MYPSVNRPRPLSPMMLRSPSRMSGMPLRSPSLMRQNASLSRSPLARSPLMARMSPMMSPRMSPRMSSPLLAPQMVQEEYGSNLGMIMNGILGMLDLILIAVAIYLLSTDPAYKPEMSLDEMNKHKQNRNTIGYVLLAVGIAMFLGLIGKFFMGRQQQPMGMMM